MDYQLICMSFDGDYVRDYKGSLEECKNVSENMGSKWFFYPFHLIVTEGNIVKEFNGMIHNSYKKEPMLNTLFKKRKLETIQKIFKEMYNSFIIDDGTFLIESEFEFESELIDKYYKLKYRKGSNYYNS